MLKHLKALCTLSSVSGDEGAVRDYVIEAVSPHAPYTVDALGNVIVEKKGRKTPKRKIMLAAHMDEVGFIITSVTEEGYLKFAAVGGMDKRVLIGKRVLVGHGGVLGVIGLKPIHLTGPEEQSRVPDIGSLYIDIGAADAASAKAQISLGDTACFDTAPTEMGDCLLARAIDDRAGCAAMLALIEDDLPLDVTCVFTVQEEIGTRGVAAAAFRVQPDIAIILEATTAADLATVPREKQVCKLGSGVVIPFMDGGTVYDRALCAQATALADRLEIPWQTKNVIAGGTDASAIQRSAAGVQTIGLAVPVRNLHTGCNVARIADIDHYVNLSRAILDDLGESE